MPNPIFGDYPNPEWIQYMNQYARFDWRSAIEQEKRDALDPRITTSSQRMTKAFYEAKKEKICQAEGQEREISFEEFLEEVNSGMPEETYKRIGEELEAAIAKFPTSEDPNEDAFTEERFNTFLKALENYTPIQVPILTWAQTRYLTEVKNQEKGTTLNGDQLEEFSQVLLELEKPDANGTVITIDSLPRLDSGKG